jgi:hypothetical protein
MPWVSRTQGVDICSGCIKNFFHLNRVIMTGLLVLETTTILLLKRYCGILKNNPTAVQLNYLHRLLEK